MDHKLSVTVQVDLDGKNVRIIATGCLTRASQRALQALIGRAHTLTSGIHVTVDLTGAHHVEAAGVDLLRQALDHDGLTPHQGQTSLLVPHPLPEHTEVVPTGVPETAPTATRGRSLKESVA